MGAELSFGKYRKHKVEFQSQTDLMSDRIKNFCGSQGFFEIPLLDEDLNKLRYVNSSSCLWSNRQSVPDPYFGLEEYVDEYVRWQHLENYIVFGMSGHGDMASSCLHLYAVEDRFAFFGQMNWGGAMMELNPEEKTAAKNYITMMLTTYSYLKGHLSEVIDADIISDQNKKLIVVGSNHAKIKTAKCAWVGETTNVNNIAWQHSNAVLRTPYAVALSMLDQVGQLQ